MRFHWLNKSIYLCVVLLLSGVMASSLQVHPPVGTVSSLNATHGDKKVSTSAPRLALVRSLPLCPKLCSSLNLHPTVQKLSRSIQQHVNFSTLVHKMAAPIVMRQTENPIQLENQKRGSIGWQLAGPVADDVQQQIKGFASAVSVNQGDAIAFYVTVHPSQSYTIDIYRIGWYDGYGGRLMKHLGPLNGIAQQPCPVAITTGMIECRWSAPVTFTIPHDWTSGIYLARLTNVQHYQNYIMFVVRNDQQAADLLYQQPVDTYQAYNDYPADGLSGKSLYPYNSFGITTTVGTKQAVKVSFDRPYNGAGDGGFTSYASYELYFVRWLERMGYNVTYATDLDVHRNGAALTKYKALLIGGHSEYWSKAMYDAARKARDAGVNLGFFGANDVYWQVRFEPSTVGVPNRVMVCYKTALQYDPAPPELKTTHWRTVGQPEQLLLGAEYGLANTITHVAPYVVTNNASWVFKGANFKNGAQIYGLVGNEIDYQQPSDPLPPHRFYEILSSSPFVSTLKTLHANANSVIYQAMSGAWVFDAGTLGWNWALGRAGYMNRGIQQATQNILDRFTRAAQAQPMAVVLNNTRSQHP